MPPYRKATVPSGKTVKILGIGVKNFPVEYQHITDSTGVQLPLVKVKTEFLPLFRIDYNDKLVCDCRLSCVTSVYGDIVVEVQGPVGVA